VLLSLEGVITAQGRQLFIDKRLREPVVTPHPGDFLDQIDGKPHVQAVGGHGHRPLGACVSYVERQRTQDAHLLGPGDLHPQQAVRERRIIDDGALFGLARIQIQHDGVDRRVRQIAHQLCRAGRRGQRQLGIDPLPKAS